MRAVILLSILGIASCLTDEQKSACLVDGSEAISDALDATLYIWAASKRCGKAGENMRCSIDALQAVKATTSMVTVIMRAVNKCEPLKTANPMCGLAAADFVKNAGGLSAAGLDLTEKCPIFKKNLNLPNISSPVMCTINVKDSAKGLVKLVTSAEAHTKTCAGKGLDCDQNIMTIAGAVAGMAAYIAGAVGQCHRTPILGTLPLTKKSAKEALCAAASASLAQYLLEVSKDAIEVHQACMAPPPKAKAVEALERVIVHQPAGRLYEEGQEMTNGSKLNLALAAFLPVVGIASFVLGRVYAASRQSQEYTRDLIMSSEA